MSSQDDKPQVYVIGDSISIQYGPFLEALLTDFRYDRQGGTSDANRDLPNGANGGDSSMVLKYLTKKLEEGQWKPDLLLLNCGLHDIKNPLATGRKQVPLKQYRANLSQIVVMVKQAGIKLAWVRTTSVPDRIHNSKSTEFKRYNADVESYNLAADEIMAAAGVPIADLYAFSKQFGEPAFCDHVHYTEEVSRKQAKFLADFIKKLYENGQT